MAEKNRIDQFFAMHSARADHWRDALTCAESWAAGRGKRADVEAALAEPGVVEEFHAYPGPRLMGVLGERIAGDDAAGTATLARRISTALLTGSYRSQAGEWDAQDDEETNVLARVIPPTLGGESHRPYFEVLYVNSQPASRWPALAAELRRLRRPEDQFVYEPVFVGSFEDAVCAAVANPSIAAVAATEGFPFRSRHDAPVLRTLIDPVAANGRRTPRCCASPRRSTASGPSSTSTSCRTARWKSWPALPPPTSSSAAPSRPPRRRGRPISAAGCCSAREARRCG